jgi:ribosomal-protein-alanine N-acetyltransferase
MLIAEDLETARAAQAGNDALAGALGSRLADGWPPEFFGEAIGYWLPELEKNPDLLGWTIWYVVHQVENSVIGLVAFKGLPVNGRVDVGYSIVATQQRNGYATEAVQAIIDWAFTDERVERIVGETMPDLAPSIKVMERLGFELVGTDQTGHGGEEGVIQYQIHRSEFDRR